MTWKDELRKILDEDPDEMTSFMNVSPRMKREAEKRKGSKGKDEDTMKAYDLLNQVAQIVNKNRETDAFTEKFVESLDACIRELGD